MRDERLRRRLRRRSHVMEFGFVYLIARSCGRLLNGVIKNINLWQRRRKTLGSMCTNVENVIATFTLCFLHRLAARLMRTWMTFLWKRYSFCEKFYTDLLLCTQLTACLISIINGIIVIWMRRDMFSTISNFSTYETGKGLHISRFRRLSIVKTRGVFLRD